MRKFVVVGFLVLAACGRPAETPTTTSASATAEPHEVLPFIHDDYPRAMAEAQKAKKPLFVDAWAPWCHSCQSLRTYVLTDPSLAPLKDSFVWLSVDTEKDVNAKWVAEHPHDALPTLWVIDPTTNKPLLKWAGTATASELTSLLKVATSGANDAFERGNQLLAAGDTKGAIAQHRAALAATSNDDPKRSRIVEALVTELSLSHDDAGCADTAATEASWLQPGTSRATVLVEGLGCAGEAKNAAARDKLLSFAIPDLEDRDRSILPDDRSALYEAVIDTKKDLGDDAGAKTLATQWNGFLDDAAKKAATKDARTALDPWRVTAAIAAGDPARVIPVLEESARDFPQDYNPPARLGRVYLVLKRLDEAEKAADKAIALVYGPRAMRVYELRADIAKARGDKAGETKALEEALAKSANSQLTVGQRGVRDGLAKRLAALK